MPPDFCQHFTLFKRKAPCELVKMPRENFKFCSRLLSMSTLSSSTEQAKRRRPSGAGSWHEIGQGCHIRGGLTRNHQIATPLWIASILLPTENSGQRISWILFRFFVLAHLEAQKADCLARFAFGDELMILIYARRSCLVTYPLTYLHPDI